MNNCSTFSLQELLYRIFSKGIAIRKKRFRHDKTYHSKTIARNKEVWDFYYEEGRFCGTIAKRKTPPLCKPIPLTKKEKEKRSRPLYKRVIRLKT